MNIGMLMLVVGAILSAVSLMGLHEDKPNPGHDRKLESVVAKCYPKEI